MEVLDSSTEQAGRGRPARTRGSAPPLVQDPLFGKTLRHWAEAQCHLLFPQARACIISGADALGGALWARRPPGRPAELWRGLILRRPVAQRAPPRRSATQLMQYPM